MASSHVQAFARGDDLVFACAAHAPKGEGWKAVTLEQQADFGVRPDEKGACLFCKAEKAPSVLGFLASQGEA